jgi:hypothetical protein
MSEAFNCRRVLFLLTFFCLNWILPVSAQQYAKSLPAEAKEYPFFNNEFIKKKTIKSIRTKVMYKSPMQKIIFSAELMQFDFSRNGDVEQWKSVNRSGNERNIKYYLSKEGRLISEDIKTTKENVLKSYVYDSLGNVIEIQKVDQKQIKTFDPENFSYEYYSDTQYKKFWLNNEGLTFKYAIVNLASGVIMDKTTRYIRGAGKETIYYHYQSGTLISYAKNTKVNTRREIKFNLEYDEEDILQIMNEYHDGALVYRFEYLYEDGLVVAILRKEIKTHQIKITKYVYTFFIE